MKIICTEEEREVLRDIFQYADLCIMSNVDCSCSGNCKDCVIENIEWDIINQ